MAHQGQPSQALLPLNWLLSIVLGMQIGQRSVKSNREHFATCCFSLHSRGLLHLTYYTVLKA